jgi:hypothetical protein
MRSIENDRLNSVSGDLSRLAKPYGEVDGKTFHADAFQSSTEFLPNRALDRLSQVRSRAVSLPFVITASPSTREPSVRRLGWRWRLRTRPGPAACFILLTAQLGEFLCWSTLQDGRLLSDVVAIRGARDTPAGPSSDRRRPSDRPFSVRWQP